VTGNAAYELGGGIFEDTYATLSIQRGSVVTNNADGDILLDYGASAPKISSDSQVGLILNWY
jgi:hypothetical protein